MKKNPLILGLFAFAATLYSCNSDDDAPLAEPIVKKHLIKSIEVRSLDDSNPSNLEYDESLFYFTYENDRLVKLENDLKTYNTNFIYENNSLTRIDQFSHGKLQSTVNLTYLDNLLKTSLTYEKGIVTERHDYLYTNRKLVQENICSQAELCDGKYGKKYTYSNDNIIQSVDNSYYKSTSTYTFDNSKHAFSDMPAVIQTVYHESFQSLNKNNVINEKQDWSSDGTINRAVVYTYQLDADNFPLTIVGTNEKGQEYIRITYTYQ